jgi:hypothetical protein
MGLREGQAELVQRSADAAAVRHPDLEEQLLRLARDVTRRRLADRRHSLMIPEPLNI